jgi:G:T/U-mismatch repair DNA glycosylase
MIRGFDPIASRNAKVLVLGTIPGRQSLAMGQYAEALFRRFVLPGLPHVRSLPLLRMPSTSPANARLTRNDKLDAWRALVDALKSP